MASTFMQVLVYSVAECKQKLFFFYMMAAC